MTTVLKPEYHDFFEWLPDEHFRFASEDGNRYLVKVVGSAIAQYRADVVPPNPTPTVGWYVLYTDEDSIERVEVFGTDVQAEQAAVLAVLAGVAS